MHERDARRGSGGAAWAGPSRVPSWLGALACVALAGLGCGARTELETCSPGASRDCEAFCGAGRSSCVGGRWSPCSAREPDASLTLPTTVRDLRASHPDFEEDALGLDLGIVEPTLGPDGKPVYAGDPVTPTTSGAEAFESWFRDVPGVNLATTVPLVLTSSGGALPTYRYDSSAFFPIDDQLFGNEGRPHNFHFTLELAVPFRYSGGERFVFRGDDDVFAFIDGALVIDLGGVHSPEARAVELDAVAPALGLEVGGVYSLALFFAERHTDGSNFHVETTIADFAVCD